MNSWLVLPMQVSSSKSFLSPRQLQLTLPSEVSRHRSWHPPLLTRHRENSPMPTLGKLSTHTHTLKWMRISDPTSTLLTHKQTHSPYTRIHTSGQKRLPECGNGPAPCWMLNSMWLNRNGICSRLPQALKLVWSMRVLEREKVYWMRLLEGEDGWQYGRGKNIGLHRFKSIQTMGDVKQDELDKEVKMYR